MNYFTCEVSTNSLNEVAIFKKGILKSLLKKGNELNFRKQTLDTILEKYKSVNSKTYLHPGLVSTNSKNDDFFNSQSDFEKYIDKFLSLPNDYNSTIYLPDTNKHLNAIEDINWSEYSLNKQEVLLIEETKDQHTLKLGSPYETSGKNHMETSLKYLKECWPEVHELTVSIVNHVVWFNSPSYWSGTDGLSFGAIYVGPREDWNMLNYFETWLHEGGHLHLLIKELIKPLLINPNDKVKSPLRTDLRPVRGTLHACFVLARMSEGLHRFSKLDTPYKDQALNMTRINVERLKSGLEYLGETPKFTAEGRKLISSIEETSQKLSKIYLN